MSLGNTESVSFSKDNFNLMGTDDQTRPILSMNNMKTSITPYYYTEDFRTMGIFWDRNIRLFPTFIEKYPYYRKIRTIEDTHTINNIMEKASTIENKKLCENVGFKMPKFAKNFYKSYLGHQFMSGDSIVFSCPDIISKPIIKLLENIYEKYEENLKATQSDETMSIENSFESSFDKSNSLYWNKTIFKRYNYSKASSKKRKDERNIQKIKRTIIKKFPKDSRKIIGNIFTQRLFNKSVSQALDELTIFIVINELINNRLKDTNSDLSLVDIFPTIKTNNNPQNDNVFMAHLVGNEYVDFMRALYTKFTRLSFDHNEYSDRLACIVFTDTFVDITPDKNFTVEDVFHFYGVTSSIANFKASDYIAMCEKLVMDDYAQLYVNNDVDTTTIDNIVSIKLLETTNYFYLCSDFYNKLSGSSINHKKRQRREYKQLVQFNLFYRNYAHKIAQEYGKESSDNMRTLFTSFFLPVLSFKAMKMNSNRRVDNYLFPDDVVSAAFLLSQAQFFHDRGMNNSSIFTIEEAESHASYIFDTDNFFSDINLESIMMIAESFSANSFKVPVNLIKSTIFPVNVLVS